MLSSQLTGIPPLLAGLYAFVPPAVETSREVLDSMKVETGTSRPRSLQLCTKNEISTQISEAFLVFAKSIKGKHITHCPTLTPWVWLWGLQTKMNKASSCLLRICGRVPHITHYRALTLLSRVWGFLQRARVRLLPRAKSSIS